MSPKTPILLEAINVEKHYGKFAALGGVSLQVRANTVHSVIGPTGAGKTWLACAFAHQAIRNGMPVAYRRMPVLMEEIEIAREDGSLPRLRASLAKC